MIKYLTIQNVTSCLKHLLQTRIDTDPYPEELRAQAKAILEVVDGATSNGLSDHGAGLYLTSLLLAFQAGRLFQEDQASNIYAMELAQDVLMFKTSGIAPQEPGEDWTPEADATDRLIVSTMFRVFEDLTEDLLSLPSGEDPVNGPSVIGQIIALAKLAKANRAASRLGMFADYLTQRCEAVVMECPAVVEVDVRLQAIQAFDAAIDAGSTVNEAIEAANERLRELGYPTGFKIVGGGEYEED